MKLDLSKQYDINKANVHFNMLLKKGKKIELKEIRKTRSIKHNAYLHVCIQLFSIHFGYTLEESKTHLKRTCDFMRYEKEGEIFLKQTSKMDSKELSEFVEWIRNYSADNGCYIPTSEEYLSDKFNIDKEINSNKEFL